VAKTHRVLGSPDEDRDANSLFKSEWGRIDWNQEQSGTLGGLALGPILTRSLPWMNGLDCKEREFWTPPI
jgi:hypothetical protein